MRDQVADVLQDFAAVLVEQIAIKIEAGIDWEADIMNRVSGVVQAFREGDTSIENAYAQRCSKCRTKMEWTEAEGWKCPSCGHSIYPRSLRSV